MCEITKDKVEVDAEMSIVMKGMFVIPLRKTYSLRIIARNFPETGAVSVLLAPHDPSTPPPPELFRGNVRIIRVIFRPTDTPGRTLQTAFARFQLGKIPFFISNLLMGYIISRMPAKIEAGYRNMRKLKETVSK